jgi:uncharacterized protein YehS (DUF1456 family)
LTNNDILRRLRYTFNFNDKKMVALFALAGVEVTREQISAWLKKDDDPALVRCNDSQFASFLNGLINDRRGKKEGPQPEPEKRLTNNIILTKLKIAFNLKAEDIITMLSKANLSVSKPELSALFRKPAHQHYRECKDQFLRNFLQGIDDLYHVERSEKYKVAKPEIIEEEPIAFKKTTYGTASAGASKIYVNPNAKVVEKEKTTRKVLKLKPEDIWK